MWHEIREQAVDVPDISGLEGGFGSIHRLPPTRYVARYRGSDGVIHSAPLTFDTKAQAYVWLATVRADMSRGLWRPPTEKPLTFGEYAESWVTDRTLKPTTRSHYRRILTRHLLPTFGPMPLKSITPDVVVDWHSKRGTDTPTKRAHEYALLRSILGSAVKDHLIDWSPCNIGGAGNSRRAHRIRTATLEELTALTQAMPERYRLMVTLAAWCALRFGELTELRRGDIDLHDGVIRVRRGVFRVDGASTLPSPKADAETRDVAIPPHIVAAISAHLSATVSRGCDELLFPAADGVSHLATSTFYGRKAMTTQRGFGFNAAREAAGRPDLRLHDLRHTGAVLAAQAGATLSELMSRLGHSSAGAARRPSL